MVAYQVILIYNKTEYFTEEYKGGTINMLTKEMTVGQVLKLYPQTVQVFLELGMHCLGCPSSTMESIEGAALTHGRNAEELVAQLNKAIAVV